MPRSGRKSCHGRSSFKGEGNAANFADYTIYDFANAENSSLMTGKSRKVYESAPMKMVKDICTKVAVPWYEKDEDDFVGEFDEDAENVDPFADEDVGDHIPRKQKLKKKPFNNEGTIVYPYDFWSAISAFIYPEDIGRFAAINHATHQITHTAQFWKNLYIRYYDPKVENLSEYLRPRMTIFQHGLRSRVIKALYILYPPFVEMAQKNKLQFSEKLDSLNGARCSIIWHQKVKNYWLFYFKFKRHVVSCPLAPKGGSAPPTPKKLFIDRDSNIYANEEDGCSVLKVTCGNFISFPWQIMGQVLRGAALSVSRDMQWHKLKLIFDDYLQTNNSYSSNEGLSVILDPVMNVQKIDWWEKAYPIDNK